VEITMMISKPGNHSPTAILYNNLLAAAHLLEETPEDLQTRTTLGDHGCNETDHHHQDLKDHRFTGRRDLQDLQDHRMGHRRDLQDHHGALRRDRKDHLLDHRKDLRRDLHGDNHHRDLNSKDQRNAGSPLLVGLQVLTAACPTESICGRYKAGVA
jgi:hypothetical protein